MKSKAASAVLPAAAMLAALAVAGQPRAQEDEDAARLAKPESRIEFGLGYLAKDGARFGQYTGVRKDGLYGIGELDIVKRDDATGTWMRVLGRNLGFDNRELRFEHNRQGNWGYFVDFSQTPRFSPYTVNTGLQGIGSNSQTISVAGKSDIQLNTQRDALTLGFEKFLWQNWSFSARFRNEEKDGSRLFGRGNSDQEFLAEPINFTTRQLETTLAYTGEKLQLSGGYYGTWFTNRNTQLNVFGGTNSSTTSPGGNFQTIGLPPDNRSYQFHLGGGYNITPTTRATFKVASARLQQSDGFPAGFFVSAAVPSTVPLAPGVPGNLGGRIDTTQMQFGISSRPMPKLSLRADFRHEDRADKTPIYTYLTGTTGTSTSNGQNEPRSIKSTNGKAEASYALPMGLRVTGGIDYEERERNASAVRIVSTRLKTAETSYRAELRRSLSETLNGAVSFVRSDRGGSEWLTTTLNNGTAGSNLMYPMFLADRERNKLRGVIDWSPTEALTLNFVVENAKDTYTQRYVGLRDGKAQLYSVDGAYTISEKWQANAWYTRNNTSSNMQDCRASTTASPLLPNSNAFCPDTAANETWEARLRNTSDALGFGVKGKPSGVLEVGADLQYVRDRAEQRVNVLSPGAVPSVAFPDIHYNRTTLRLYGKYAINKSEGLRLQYTHDRFKTDDWTWTNYVYGANPNPAATDGTTVRQNMTQNVDFIGVSYYFAFR